LPISFNLIGLPKKGLSSDTVRRRAEAFGDDEEDDCINYTNQLYATQKTTVGIRKPEFKASL
jgi:hypothetical protein